MSEKPTVYAGQHLENIQMPVGGIAAGEIMFDSHARMTDWHTCGSFDPLHPCAFLALRVQDADHSPAVRALQTIDQGPFKGMTDRTFSGELPFGWYNFIEEALPLKASMEVFNPMIPLNLKDSAIPAAIITVVLENTGASDLNCSVALMLFNPFDDAGSAQAIDHNTALLKKTNGESVSTIAVMGQGEGITVTLNGSSDPVTVHETFEKNGVVPEIANDPDARGVVVLGKARISSGKTDRFRFILTWHSPGVTHGGTDDECSGWRGEGNQYEAWWNDAGAVARYVCDQGERLERATRLFHDALYESNHPRWLTDRIINPLSMLRSPTVFWTRSGFFGGWEGCTTEGCCGGNCNHVWQYAQGHARLWPELGRIMRGQQFRAMAEDGAIPFRLPSGRPAFDGQCGDILGAYREHLMSTDDTWLREHWAAIRRAMCHLIVQHDKDNDGVPTDGAMHHTLDADLQGGCSWLGSLYLAALAACKRMAERMDDGAFADRCDTLWQSGASKQDRLFWNGSYYQGDDRNYAHGCSIDQVLGEWWAHQLGLPRAYPEDRVRSAMEALMEHNWGVDPERLPGKSGWWADRRFITEYQNGLITLIWPDGNVPPTRPHHHSTHMSGFEQTAAATMIHYGLTDAGLQIMRAIADRYNGQRHTEGLVGKFGTSSGNPFGSDECGRWYARGMSSWSLLLALQGFHYDGPTATIRFAPVWRPENHTSFFCAAEGWGVFRQNRVDNRQVNRIDIRHGRLSLQTLQFTRHGDNVVVTAGGTSVSTDTVVEEGMLSIRFPSRLSLDAEECHVLEIVQS